MKLTIDTDGCYVTKTEGDDSQSAPMWSKQAFEWVSREWVRIGWDQKYQYSFSWMGRPVIQLPEDMIRTQEVIHRLQPDVILETGVAHGGSLIFYASLCKVMDKGRIIGVDIEIRKHNREAIEAHPLANLITLIEGSSTDPKIVAKAKAEIKADDRVLVLLDSNHSYAHVLGELEAYAPLVSVDSYIVATDGIMYDLTDTPRGAADWDTNNPLRAAEDFVASHPGFVLEQPAWPFNESKLTKNITHWPGAWLRRVE